jgi:hypothetical protein
LAGISPELFTLYGMILLFFTELSSAGISLPEISSLAGTIYFFLLNSELSSLAGILHLNFSRWPE